MLRTHSITVRYSNIGHTVCVCLYSHTNIFHHVDRFMRRFLFHLHLYWTHTHKHTRPNGIHLHLLCLRAALIFNSALLHNSSLCLQMLLAGRLCRLNRSSDISHNQEEQGHDLLSQLFPYRLNKGTFYVTKCQRKCLRCLLREHTASLRYYPSLVGKCLKTRLKVCSERKQKNSLEFEHWIDSRMTTHTNVSNKCTNRVCELNRSSSSSNYFHPSSLS